MADDALKQRILSLIPQQKPFRFIDEIISVSGDHVVSSYQYKADEWFYSGHFPGNPVTPGVILVETMAQAGLTVLAIHTWIDMGFTDEEIRKKITLFALIDAMEFDRPVMPETRVIVKAEKKMFRHGNLKTAVSMELESGEPVCRGIITGKGVEHGQP